MKDVGRVDLVEELLSCRCIRRDDRIGVMRPIAVDVIDRCINAVHDPHGGNHVRILRMPLAIGYCLDLRRDRARTRTAADTNLLLRESLHQLGKKSCRNLLMNQHRLQRIAYRRILHLAVHHDRQRHLLIGCRIDIRVADAIRMPKHRNSRIPLNVLHQRIRSARNHQVDTVVHREQGSHRFAAVHRANRIRRNVRGRQRLHASC